MPTLTPAPPLPPPPQPPIQLQLALSVYCTYTMISSLVWSGDCAEFHLQEIGTGMKPNTKFEAIGAMTGL